MRISIGLELNNEGRALAWALDFPGCFAYGQMVQKLPSRLAQALVTYETWAYHQVGADWVCGGKFRFPRGRYLASLYDQRSV